MGGCGGARSGTSRTNTTASAPAPPRTGPSGSPTGWRRCRRGCATTCSRTSSPILVPEHSPRFWRLVDLGVLSLSAPGASSSPRAGGVGPPGGLDGFRPYRRCRSRRCPAGCTQPRSARGRGWRRRRPRSGGPRQARGCPRGGDDADHPQRGRISGQDAGTGSGRGASRGQHRVKEEHVRPVDRRQLLVVRGGLSVRSSRSSRCSPRPGRCR